MSVVRLWLSKHGKREAYDVVDDSRKQDGLLVLMGTFLDNVSGTLEG